MQGSSGKASGERELPVPDLGRREPRRQGADTPRSPSGQARRRFASAADWRSVTVVTSMRAARRSSRRCRAASVRVGSASSKAMGSSPAARRRPPRRSRSAGEARRGPGGARGRRRPPRARRRRRWLGKEGRRARSGRGWCPRSRAQTGTRSSRQLAAELTWSSRGRSPKAPRTRRQSALVLLVLALVELSEEQAEDLPGAKGGMSWLTTFPAECAGEG